MEDSKMQITTVLIEEKESYIIREDYPVLGAVKRINVNGMYDGWNRVRNEIKDPYIYLNTGNTVPNPSKEQLDDLKRNKIKMILIGLQCRYQWDIQYQNWYYGYDFKVMMSVLENYYPQYYKFANKELLNTNIYYLFAGIFSKKDYDRIWDWINEVINKCEKNIPVRLSTDQNKWREHMVPFLFTIYVRYWKVRTKPALSPPYYLDKNEDCLDKNAVVLPDKDAPRDEILEFLSRMVSEGKIETASGFSLNNLVNRNDMFDVCEVFREYERQRQFDDLTTLDKEGSLEKVLLLNKVKAPDIKDLKPQMLIFKWKSFGHENIIKAFESFGFECTCISLPDLKWYGFDEEFYTKLNKCMDSKAFDVVYSTNYTEMIAQACYMYNIPYIAWCYDAFASTGNSKYIFSSTTNLFLFDSADCGYFKNEGVKNAYYLPLAANFDVYDNIRCSDEDHSMYDADISFVGQLYDSTITKAMGYLSDYQQGFLGALIDNQTNLYGYNFFPEIIMGETINWLSNPKFNMIINDEVCKINKSIIENIDNRSNVNADALTFVLNKQTTNKERMLVVLLLAKYHEVKLYADKTSELFNNLTFCGRVDYYTQMPKIFKCSKINLNSTFRNIKNGIPLRCIDVMACGGCLLTNYQKDFDDHFKDNENVLFYRDAGEALEKADFYLAHESLREKVALSGYETVKKYYSYPVKIKEMLEMAGLHDLVKACERNRGL